MPPYAGCKNWQLRVADAAFSRGPVEPVADLPWTEIDAAPADLDFKPPGKLEFQPIEAEIGLSQPAATFSLFDHALRNVRGETPAEHRARNRPQIRTCESRWRSR